jgi:DNA-3-methyladenine glycosylase I
VLTVNGILAWIMKRCAWTNGGDKNYIRYHDEEWGVPVHDDRKLFEFIVLESAQAGLSWRTILERREGYRKVFKNFDPVKVARMTKRDIERLVTDERIIRNRKKIESAINNAKRFIEVQKEFGSFSAYMWAWVHGRSIQNSHKRKDDVPGVTELAISMAKDLKKRGFSFLGPTVWYAHMQAVGMVNDHTTDCFRYKEIKRMQ